MLEEYLDGILQELLVSPAVSSFKVLRQEAGDESGFIRIKCILPNGDILEFALYLIVHKNKIHIETYSFHRQTSDGELVKRWDNVAHHKEIKTFPHHIHLSDGKVVDSGPMTLGKVLMDIEKTISVDVE
ncbi:MAG TPA: hypothetical protein ENG83_07415 [Nitrospirae bacterium]|nr:hypothetical protein BMS3Abin06_01637 [bacterium BMS3Abin06]HDH12008.1 hypothetical protein [Nitrospirota bacterium]HDZ00828.1 hypothetical protein [Nitrospirota bacterium]